jgi:serine protease inhibitor
MTRNGRLYVSTMALIVGGLLTFGLYDYLSRGNEKMPAPVLVIRADSPLAPQLSAKIAPRQNRFGFKLFAELRKEKPDQNLFISPSSIAFALTMTYNGADGETKEAMEKALELQGMTLDDINRGSAALRALLDSSDPKVKLAIANSLWMRADFDFNPDFLKANRSYFGAEMTNLNFDDPGAVGTINDWVRRSTAGKITQIVDRIEGQTVLFLINAIYFHGEWTEKFKKDMTSDRPFTLPDGRTKQHPLMFQQERFAYGKTDAFQVIELPYGEGRMSMYVFLPAKSSSLSAFLKTLNEENWNRWMSGMERKKGLIGLPRFKMEYETMLKDSLSALGMGVAFDPERANLTKMRPADQANDGQRLFISRVKHKTYLDVNEEGTEAAAVTSVEVGVTSAPVEPEKPFEMVVDRPFFLAIRDRQTGAILFMGAIVDPPK